MAEMTKSEARRILMKRKKSEIVNIAIELAEKVDKLKKEKGFWGFLKK